MAVISVSETQEGVICNSLVEHRYLEHLPILVAMAIEHYWNWCVAISLCVCVSQKEREWQGVGRKRERACITVNRCGKVSGASLFGRSKASVSFQNYLISSIFQVRVASLCLSRQEWPGLRRTEVLSQQEERLRCWQGGRKDKKLNFRPPDTPPRVIPVCHEDLEKCWQLYNDPWCRVQLVWGKGAGVVVAFSSSSCCQIEFVARQGPPRQWSTKHTHTYTHTVFWLVWEPAALIHGLVLSFSVTQAHFSLWRHPAASQAHWQQQKKAAHGWVKRPRLTARLEGAGRGWRRNAVLYGSVCGVPKNHVCPSCEGTSTQSSHCLGNPPFF